MRYLTVLLFFVFLTLFNSTYSQNNYVLIIKTTDSTISTTSNNSFFNAKKIDSLKVEDKLKKEIYKLQSKGYLESNIDSLSWNKQECIAYIRIGNKYKWLKLGKGNVEEAALSESGYREKIYHNAVLKEKQTADLFKKIIRYYEENGYPFASIRLDSVKINNYTTTASLLVNKNKKISIDSIVYDKNVKLAASYLYSYIGIKPGNLYQESKIKQVQSRLNELAFLTVTGTQKLVITDKYTTLSLAIKNKKANQFDGVLGILPNDITGKILFTGQTRLRLENTIGKGELVDVDWRKLQAETQDLKGRIAYPFLFKSPFGIDGNIKLYKRDSAFIDVQLNTGIQYLLSGGNYYKIFINNRNTNLIATSHLRNINQLPKNADIKVIGYGIGVKYEKTNYRLNPSKGYAVMANTSAGNKTIVINANLPVKIYEGLILKTVQYQFDFYGAAYFSLAKKNVIALSNRTAGIFGKNLFQNEVFRIGGLATLRGFDEESIYASSYTISTFEYRFLADKNSYFFGFFSTAYYEKRIINEFIHDTPYGFGTGISFETKAGIFNITYALGKQFDNPIVLRSAKIHFGIINIF